VTQPDHSMSSLPWDGLTEEVACLGMRLAGDPFRDLFRDLERRVKEVLASKPKQRKPSHKTFLNQARKAGATSVTVEGVTYTFGAADAAESNPFELEARRLRRQRGAV
jgi:hypothetical protein